jgi:hypothetical protein
MVALSMATLAATLEVGSERALVFLHEAGVVITYEAPTKAMVHVVQERR